MADAMPPLDLQAPQNVQYEMKSLDHIIDYRRINPGHYNSPPKWARLTKRAIRATRLTNGTLLHESDCKDCKRKLLRLVCIFRFSDAALAVRKDTCKQCGKLLVRQISPSAGQEAELLRHKLEQLDWNQTLALAKNGKIGLAGLGMLRRGSLQPEAPGLERRASSKALQEAAEALSEVVQEAAEEESSMLPPGMRKTFTLLDQLKEDEPRLQQLIQEIREKNQVLYNLPGPQPIDEQDAARKAQEGQEAVMPSVLNGQENDGWCRTAEMRSHKAFRRNRKDGGLPPQPSTKELETVNERRLSQVSCSSGPSKFSATHPIANMNNLLAPTEEGDATHTSRLPSIANSKQHSKDPSPAPSHRASRNNSIHETAVPEVANPADPRVLTAEILIKEALSGTENVTRTLLPDFGGAASPWRSHSPVSFPVQEKGRTAKASGHKGWAHATRGPAIVTMSAQNLPLSRSTEGMVVRGSGFVTEMSRSQDNHSPSRSPSRAQSQLQFLREESASEHDKKKALIRESFTISRDTVNFLRDHSTDKFIREQTGSNGKLTREQSGDFHSGARFLSALIRERSSSSPGRAPSAGIEAQQPRQIVREDSDGATETINLKTQLKPASRAHPERQCTGQGVTQSSSFGSGKASRSEGGGLGVNLYAASQAHLPVRRAGGRKRGKTHVQTLSSGIRGIRQSRPGISSSGLGVPARTEVVMPHSVLQLPSLGPSRATTRPDLPNPMSSHGASGIQVPGLKVGPPPVIATVTVGCDHQSVWAASGC